MKESKFRTVLAVAICKMAYRGMQLLGRTGRALPGKLALKVYPDVLGVLAREVKTVVVTGTNGKTTTTHIIAQGLENLGEGCAFDPSCTNLMQGITTTFALNAHYDGRPRCAWAAIECDEGATKRALPYLKPEVVVVTNLYRDQTDRFADPSVTRDYIKTALLSVPDTTVVLDADCPYTASLAVDLPNPVWWYGVSTDVYREQAAGIDADTACIMCGSPLVYGHRTFAHLGDFSCPACGHRHPEPTLEVTDVRERRETSCILDVRIKDAEHTVEAGIRAGYDIYNGAAAVTGMLAAGLDEVVAFDALTHFTHPVGRFEYFDVEGAPLRTLLMKNAAGCNQLINMLISEEEPPTNLICLLNNQICDGVDIGWIDDVAWEKLCSENTRVLCGGERADDMAARLLRAGVLQDNLRIMRDYDMLVDEIAHTGKATTMIANCSALADCRLVLAKRYKTIDYWA